MRSHRALAGTDDQHMRPTPVVAYTDTHQISGTLSLKGRIRELLVDPMSDYLDLHDGRATRMSTEDTIGAFAPRVTIPKLAVHAITAEDGRHAGSASQSGTKVSILTASWEILGSIRLSNPNERLSLLLSRELGSFFPVLDATMTWNVSPSVYQTVETVMVNRHQVVALSLL